MQRVADCVAYKFIGDTKINANPLKSFIWGDMHQIWAELHSHRHLLFSDLISDLYLWPNTLPFHSLIIAFFVH